MEEMGNPFRKAGIVLLIIGILDIGVMIYCITNKINYSSSFNIFAVIAGLFLIKGGIKTARVVRWFSAFFIFAFIGMLFLLPLAMPFDLLIAQFKLNPWAMLGSYAFLIVFICILACVYFQLSSTEALEKLSQAGFKTGKPKSALYLALAFMLLGGVLYNVIYYGEAAEKAKALAHEQLGPSYKYHISSLSYSGNKGNAVVTAYTNEEIKHVRVKW